MPKPNNRTLRQAIRQQYSQAPDYWPRIAAALEERPVAPRADHQPRRIALRLAAGAAGLAAAAVLAVTVLPRLLTPGMAPAPASGQPTQAPPSTPTGTVRYDALRLAPVGDVQPLEGGEAAGDIAAFSERILEHCDLLGEVTVTDRYQKEYRYDVASDKFEANGRLHMQRRTTVFVLRLEEVLAGEAKAGDTIRAEVTSWGCLGADSESQGAAMLPGRRYIVPLSRASWPTIIDKETEGWVSGDVTRDGAYEIVYPFAPQIEVTLDGQYVFHEGWESLINAQTVDVLLEQPVPQYGSRLKLRADSAFKSDLCRLLERTKVN